MLRTVVVTLALLILAPLALGHSLVLKDGTRFDVNETVQFDRQPFWMGLTPEGDILMVSLIDENSGNFADEKNHGIALIDCHSFALIGVYETGPYRAYNNVSIDPDRSTLRLSFGDRGASLVIDLNSGSSHIHDPDMLICNHTLDVDCTFSHRSNLRACRYTHSCSDNESRSQHLAVPNSKISLAAFSGTEQFCIEIDLPFSCSDYDFIHDDRYLIAASCGSLCGAITIVDTGSLEITTLEGFSPLSEIVPVLDGQFALVNSPEARRIEIIDVVDRARAGVIQFSSMTPSFPVCDPSGKCVYIANRDGNSVARLSVTPAPLGPDDPKTEVVVLGTIHSGHLDSELYSLDVLMDLVRAVKADDVCAEIPPDRWRYVYGPVYYGTIVTDSRVSMFPEYIDSIFPLVEELHLRIIPTAGWTQHMADERKKKLDAISKDPARADQWAEHEAAVAQLDADIAALGGSDDPRAIHSDAYDAAVKRGYGGPYNEYFNEELGDGGWDTINARHYGHIADHLDRVRGEGRRVLVTYGAYHKYWFLEKLRERDDVVILDVNTFLDEIGR